MAFEPHIEETPEPPGARGLVLLTAQRDGDVAGEWHDALLRAGLEAELHIRDAASFNLTSTVYPTGAPFVYVLFVAKDDRERAANVLIDLGWDGRGVHRDGAMRVPQGGALRGALVAIAVGLALAVALILLRGA
jgi:hypothetical protein